MSCRAAVLPLVLIAVTAAACGRPADPASDTTAAASAHAGHAAVGDPASDPVAYLGQLGLVRGHLLVGRELYRRGELEAARSHMKHPSDELYATLVSAFQTRGVPGFAAELERLATLVEGTSTDADVETAYIALVAAIDNSEQPARAAATHSAGTDLRVAAYLVKTAGEEYAIGVVDGRVVTPHEYQDAFGFVQVARSLVESVAAPAGGEDALRRARAAFSGLDHAWPSLPQPEGPVRVTAAAFDETASLLDSAATDVDNASR